jgi:hypothetical protein
MYVLAGYFFSLSLYFYNINPIRVLKYNLIKLNRKINRKMDKNFDELLMNFDEFSKGKNKLEIETNKFIDLISDISNHNKGGEDTSEIETNLENKLGEPDSVTYYYEDGLFVEKSAWKQASGLVIRTIKQKKPFDGEKF